MSLQATRVHHLSDTSFDKHATERYRLSVHIRPEGFSFTVVDDDLNRILLIHSYDITPAGEKTNFPVQALSGKIKVIMHENDWLARPFKDIFVIWEDKYYTFIPADIFKKDKSEKYLSFVKDTKKDAGIKLGDEYIERLDSNVVYSIPGEILNLVSEYLPKSSIKNHMSVLIRHLPVATITESPEKMYVNLRKKTFDMLLFREEKLLLANAYDYKTPEDILYYINFISGQYQADIRTLVIGLTGQVEENTLVHRVLEDYLPLLQFTGFSKHQPAAALENVPKHMYFIPFNVFR